jgi:uncharacterized membrane protein SpoIIM required for sporulation
MVFERLYLPILIKKKRYYAFILGLVYATIGISGAVFLFPDDPAIVAIAFISLLLLTTLYDVFKIKEKIDIKESITKHLIKEHFGIFIIYFYLFISILVIFAFFSISLPSITTNHIFKNQIDLVETISTKEMYQFNSFMDIVPNNFKVLLALLLAAFLFGSGTIFLFIIVWNASVIGTVFGFVAKNSAILTNENPYLFFFQIFIVTFPHLFFEISSYFLAGIIGGELSNLTFTEKRCSKRYYSIIKPIFFIFMISILFLLIAAVIEANVTPVLMRYI